MTWLGADELKGQGNVKVDGIRAETFAERLYLPFVSSESSHRTQEVVANSRSAIASCLVNLGTLEREWYFKYPQPILLRTVISWRASGSGQVK